jgi:hypothetical protein
MEQKKPGDIFERVRWLVDERKQLLERVAEQQRLLDEQSNRQRETLRELEMLKAEFRALKGVVERSRQIDTAIAAERNEQSLQ